MEEYKLSSNKSPISIVKLSFVITFTFIFSIGLFIYISKLPIDVDPKESYFDILNNLDSLNPGMGVDIFNEEIKHRPMA